MIQQPSASRTMMILECWLAGQNKKSSVRDGEWGTLGRPCPYTVFIQSLLVPTFPSVEATAFQKKESSHPATQPCLTDTKFCSLEKNGELREKCFPTTWRGPCCCCRRRHIVVISGSSVSQRQTRYVYCTAGQWCVVHVTLAEAVKAWLYHSTDKLFSSFQMQQPCWLVAAMVVTSIPFFNLLYNGDANAMAQ
jgi:hypothetical protein